MKVVLLAGGFGTRISEESVTIPKPMIEIGGKPILWHIMNIYAEYGHNEFIVLLGYKGYVVKEYFANYFLHQSDVTIDLKNNNIEIHSNKSEPWKITLIDTGLNTMTGGRIKQAQKYIEEESFLLTYGDGLSDIDIGKLIEFHGRHKGFVTMTSAQPEGRFGALDITKEDRVCEFVEKPQGDGAWINAGFFVCDNDIFKYIDNDETIFEQEPLKQMAKDGGLYTYKHSGFWMPMDTLRDKNRLNEMWNNKDAKWVKKQSI